MQLCVSCSLIKHISSAAQFFSTRFPVEFILQLEQAVSADGNRDLLLNLHCLVLFCRAW
jgi:hypothetical protein